MMDGSMGSMGTGNHHFKGVMLCNRPSAPAPVKTSFSDNHDSGRVPFVSTVQQPEYLGINPIAKELPPRQRKNKEEDVTFQHKAWLADFAERRAELTHMMEDTVLEQEEKTKRFQEKQAEMRATIRQVREENPNDREAMKKALGLEEKSATTKMKTKAKPKWAMTAEENENDENLQVEDLLEFTNGLDFDKYIQDIEVKEALSFVKDRVKELAEPKQYAEPEEGEGDEEYDDFATLEDREAARTLKRKERRKENEDWENASIAESEVSVTSEMSKAMLANNKQLGAVHSQASVKAMLEKQQSLAVDAPVIANTRKISKEENPSNLPYLFRSPAV